MYEVPRQHSLASHFCKSVITWFLLFEPIWVLGKTTSQTGFLNPFDVLYTRSCAKYSLLTPIRCALHKKLCKIQPSYTHSMCSTQEVVQNTAFLTIRCALHKEFCEIQPSCRLSIGDTRQIYYLIKVFPLHVVYNLIKI